MGLLRRCSRTSSRSPMNNIEWRPWWWMNDARPTRIPDPLMVGIAANRWAVLVRLCKTWAPLNTSRCSTTKRISRRQLRWKRRTLRRRRYWIPDMECRVSALQKAFVYLHFLTYVSFRYTGLALGILAGATRSRSSDAGNIPNLCARFGQYYQNRRVCFQWDQFEVDELSRCDDKLMKLYKQEIIEIVIAYERYRLALTMELNQRRKTSSSANSQSGSRAASVEPESQVAAMMAASRQTPVADPMAILSGSEQRHCLQVNDHCGQTGCDQDECRKVAAEGATVVSNAKVGNNNNVYIGTNASNVPFKSGLGSNEELSVQRF